MARIDDLIRKYQESKNYSFQDLQKEGGPAYPLLQDLLAPNMGFDPAKLRNEFLDCGLVPLASKSELVRRYVDAIKRKAIDLLVRESPTELRIDRLRADAEVEYEQQMKRVLVTIPAEKIFALLYRAARGVDPSPAPAGITPVCFTKTEVRESVISIYESAPFRRFLSLIEEVTPLRNGQSEVLVKLRGVEEALELKTFGGASEPRISVADVLDEEAIRSLLVCLDNIPESMDLKSEMSLPFEPGAKRKQEIQKHMLQVARPALEAGSALLQEMVELFSLIDWSGVKARLEEDLEGGGSMKA